jgi:hypothetical protein
LKTGYWLKHGRVAQLAVLGNVVRNFYFDFRLTVGGAEAAYPFVRAEWVKKFKSVEEQQKAQSQETENGRLALLAILELLRHNSQSFIFVVNDVLITGLQLIYGK